MMNYIVEVKYISNGIMDWIILLWLIGLIVFYVVKFVNYGGVVWFMVLLFVYFVFIV